MTLAGEATKRGHAVTFVVGAGPMTKLVSDAGFAVIELPAEEHVNEVYPPHADWLSTPWEADAEFTAKVVAQVKADWLVWDHYGLDARWVSHVRSAQVGLRVLALDDLDDRALGSDLVLSPARIGTATRRYAVPEALDGPNFALLRPEFATFRSAALGRRRDPLRRVLILPGMMDAAGLAPAALQAIDGTGLQAEVVMGSASQSLLQVQKMIANRADWSLCLDANDMADRMLRADICIGAGGGTAWERCCLGLPSIAVAVADNQRDGIDLLAKAGAIVPATIDRIAQALGTALAIAPTLSAQASKLCDGYGASRVLDVLEAQLRPVTATDIRTIFDWRNQPHVRAASHNQDPLIWEDHIAWMNCKLQNNQTLWWIYREGGYDLGTVLLHEQKDGVYRWSFYIGANDAPRGAGRRMLRMVLRELAVKTNAVTIRGEVLKSNSASIRIHQGLGFAQVPSSKEGILVFHKQICDQ